MSDMEYTPNEPEQDPFPAPDQALPPAVQFPDDSLELFQTWSQIEIAPPARIPHLGHLCLLAAFALVGFVCATLAMMGAVHFHLFGATSMAKAATDVHYILGSETIIYLITLAGSLLLFPLLWNESSHGPLRENPHPAHQPGVYLYKNAEGEVIYVGKAKNLRARVRSYLLEASQANAKTGSLMREAVDLDYILVGNESEALALETNLIKQRKPRFNILLKDDKSYPYVKLTMADRFPKVFVTRRLLQGRRGLLRPLLSRQPGLARRRADPSQLSHSQLQGRSLPLPSPRLPAVLHSSLPRPLRRGTHHAGDLQSAVRDAQLLLEGRHAELERTLTARMMEAAEAEQFEAAARCATSSPPSTSSRKSSAPPPPSRTTTPTSSAITSRTARWPSISSTSAPARSSTAASSSGKICRSCWKPPPQELDSNAWVPQVR
jgi:hypothetical protein